MRAHGFPSPYLIFRLQTLGNWTRRHHVTLVRLVIFCVYASTFNQQDRDKRSRRHKVGIQIGAYPCGVVPVFDEIFGTESTSQVKLNLFKSDLK